MRKKTPEPQFSPIKRGYRTPKINSLTRQTGQTHVTNSQAASYENRLVRCSPRTPEFSRSNIHDTNHGRQPIQIPRGHPGCQVPALANHTSESAFPMSPSPTNFHIGSTKNIPLSHNSPLTGACFTVPALLPSCFHQAGIQHLLHPQNIPSPVCSRHTSMKPAKMAARIQQVTQGTWRLLQDLHEPLSNSVYPHFTTEPLLYFPQHFSSLEPFKPSPIIIIIIIIIIITFIHFMNLVH